MGEREHEIFRYWKGEDVRVYRLRVVAGGTELWRITTRAGQPVASVMESDFHDADEAALFFGEVERTLIAGGWRVVPPAVDADD